MSSTSFSNQSVAHTLELLYKILDEINQLISMPRCRFYGNSRKMTGFKNNSLMTATATVKGLYIILLKGLTKNTIL